MHAALTITEIISNIFGSLATGDLKSCTVVCQAWFLPAVELSIEVSEYWRDLILPVFGAAGLLRQDNNLRWNFCRDPSKEEWDRLYVYSSRIRRMLLGTATGRDLVHFDPSAIDILANPRTPHEGPLFPRVQEAHWCGRFSSQLSFSLIPLAPKIEHVWVKFFDGCGDAELDHMTQALLSIRPTLVTLRVWVEQGGEEIFYLDRRWSSFCAVLSTFTHLQEFRVHKAILILTPKVIKILASLPNLRRVEGFSWRDSKEKFDLAASPEHEIFPSLDSLDIEVEMAAEALCSSWFPSKKLERLRVRMLHWRGYSGLVESLASSSSQLRSLSLATYINVRYNPALSRLKSLRKLDIFINSGYMRISDEDVANLASGLENLEELSLANRGPRNPALTLSLLSIYHLVRCCLGIKRITLNLDASHIPSLSHFDLSASYNAGQFPSGSSKLQFDPRFSRLTDPASVSEWLRRCCSRYTEVQVVIEPELEGWWVPRLLNPSVETTGENRVANWEMVHQMLKLKGL